MVKLGHISIDGTKIRANASNEKFLDKDDVELLEEIVREIEERIQEGIKVDEEEDEEDDCYEMDEKSLKLKKIKKMKIDKGKIEEVKEKIEKMKEAKGKASYTDPECRYMRSRGLKFCYNAQVSVDSETSIILARDVVNDETDHSQLIPQLEQVKANVKEYPDEVSADNSYYTTDGLLYLVEKGIDGYIGKNTVIEIKTGEKREYKKEEMRYKGRRLL